MIQVKKMKKSKKRGMNVFKLITYCYLYNIIFSEKSHWPGHDEHYHIGFDIKCQPLSPHT